MSNGDTILIITLVLSIVSILMTAIAMVIAVLALIKTIAAEKSTHSIQYVPVDEEIDKANSEFLAKDSWATKEKNIDKDYKLYQEELEDVMPEFFEEAERTAVRLSL